MPRGYPSATRMTLAMSVLALPDHQERERHEQDTADAEQDQADRHDDDAVVDGGHRDSGDQRDEADSEHGAVPGHGPSLALRRRLVRGPQRRGSSACGARGCPGAPARTPRGAWRRTAGPVPLPG